MFQPKMYDDLPFRLENGKVSKYRMIAMGEHRGELRSQIINLKYKKQKYLAPVFAQNIYKTMTKNPKTSGFDYLLPVPPSPSSLLVRGYDPVRLICENLSELWKLPLAIHILESSERHRQVKLNRAERFENVKGTFRLVDPSRVEGKSVLVFDDVSTTGATLHEVMKTLSAADPGRLAALVLSKA